MNVEACRYICLNIFAYPCMYNGIGLKIPVRISDDRCYEIYSIHIWPYRYTLIVLGIHAWLANWSTLRHIPIWPLSSSLFLSLFFFFFFFFFFYTVYTVTAWLIIYTYIQKKRVFLYKKSYDLENTDIDIYSCISRYT